MGKRNPKPTAADTCMVCGRPYAQLHEVFFGSGLRVLSMEHRLQVRLCAEHHLGASGPHMNREFDVMLKRMCQVKFERVHSREKFIELFGRNYL